MLLNCFLLHRFFPLSFSLSHTLSPHCSLHFSPLIFCPLFYPFFIFSSLLFFVIPRKRIALIIVKERCKYQTWLCAVARTPNFLQRNRIACRRLCGCHGDENSILCPDHRPVLPNMFTHMPAYTRSDKITPCILYLFTANLHASFTKIRNRIWNIEYLFV